MAAEGGANVYEAIVIDAYPDANRPGFIRVAIPELFGSDAVPVLIAPLYPGCTNGGWCSIPNTDDRVIVIRIARSTFRWMGTSIPMDFVAADPENNVGVRSKDGYHAILINNGTGICIEATSDVAYSHIILKPDGECEILNSSGGGVVVTAAGETEVKASAGQVLKLSGGGVPGSKPIIREGDRTAGHVHTLSGSAGPFPIVGTALFAQDTMMIGTGNQFVKG